MRGRTNTQIVATEGWVLLGVLLALAVFCLTVGWFRTAFVFMLAASVAAFYFRNPERIPQEQDSLVVIAPADGRIEEIALREEGVVVVIRNLTPDTHLLRMPMQGKIRQKTLRGGLLAAFGSALNRLSQLERLDLECACGLQGVSIVLMPEVAESMLYDGLGRLFLGQRIGFFYGGRVVLTLPANVELRLAVGDRVQGGESVVGFARMNG